MPTSIGEDVGKIEPYTLPSVIHSVHMCISKRKKNTSPHKNRYVNVYSNIIHRCPSAREWINLNVGYPNNELLFSNKEKCADMCYNRHET